MRSTTDIEALDAHIDAHLDERIAELEALCRIASVSSTRQQLAPCAKAVAQMLERRGFKVTTFETDAAPVVFAEIGVGPETMLFYNHYDVQPAEPLDLWTRPPFEPSRRDGALFARGAIDDKGELVSRLAAIDAFRAAYPKHKIRLKMIVEGAEEVGSPGLERFVREHAELLRADACIWEAGGIDANGRPQIALGLRGLLYVELAVRTMSRDAHSGDAHALPNAAWRLLRAVASLKDDHERILIPGFYGAVRAASEETLALLDLIPSPGPGWRKDLGVRAFAGDRADDDLASAVFSPTCNIAGFTSGYSGAGSKTVIPSQAACKIDFRLVPDQEPDAIAELLKAHFAENGFDDVEIRVLDGIHPAMSDPAAPIVATAIEAAREAWHEEPVVIPMVGGSGPMAYFTRDLRQPVISIGCSYPGGRKHAPDEHVRIDDFARGAKHVARILAAQGTNTA